MDVSIILVTYNHERFIAKAMESVMSQATDYRFELLISEDCSTDRTREIVEKYAVLHADCVRLFLSQKNLKSNEVTQRCLRAAAGRYIAFLDGDDYWISENKLQRQVEFLDNSPRCAMCFHQVMRFRDGSALPPEEHVPADHPELIELTDVLKGHYIAGSSMIRREALGEIPAWYEHAPYDDWPLYVFAAQHGSIGYLRDVLSAYRLHPGGVWSAATPVQQLEGRLRCLELFAAHLGPSHSASVAPILAGMFFEMGLAYEAAGFSAAAIDCLATSVRLRPITRAIVRRAWRLARMGATAIAGGDLTVWEATRSVSRSGKAGARTARLR
jgi:glycosyltransferase involved in cell wall biosynthesis